MLKHLPNVLTGSRLALAPVIALAVWQAYAMPEAPIWPLLAAGLFLFAALTDLFDGIAARILKAESKFGRILDPIADKALVGLPLIAISLVIWQLGQPLWWVAATATAVIVIRDFAITIWRFLAPDGEGARVSPLAKWKTAIELVAVGFPILMVAAPSFLRATELGQGIPQELTVAMMFVWFVLLVIAAGLSAVTAVQYISGKPMPLVQPAADRSVEMDVTATDSAIESQSGEAPLATTPDAPPSTPRQATPPEAELPAWQQPAPPPSQSGVSQGEAGAEPGVSRGRDPEAASLSVQGD